MSVRKRKWTTKAGIEREAWVVDYPDRNGDRRLKTFTRKKEADAFAATTHVGVREGTHVADRASITVKAAGELWIASSETEGLERSTVESYRAHLRLHIEPQLGTIKLSRLGVADIADFKDWLHRNGRSPAMVRKILVSLGSLITDAGMRGKVATNVMRDMIGKKKRRKGATADRAKRKLKVGEDIPTREDIKAIAHAATSRWRPLLLTAIFTGLRASELRGLRWADIDPTRSEIHVRQRADKFNDIGSPKSTAGQRTVPLTPMVKNALKEWRLACPKGGLDLVFPNGLGNVESLANIVHRGFIPTQIKAGVTVMGRDKEGKETPVAKYPGFHTLRHFYASWCINRRADGGLELPPKIVQERLGHATLAMTMDVYGHLFPRGDDSALLAEGEAALLA